MPASPQAAPKKPLQKIPFSVPWGLFIVLGLYAAAVYMYIWTNYWDSPEYKAARSYARALALLGDGDGRRCSEADLNQAFKLTMEAAVLLPDERGLVQHLEDLRHRFEERHLKLNKEWVNQVEMMSARTLKREQERQSIGVVGVRDKGWHPEQLLAGPERVVLWSTPGAVLIIAFYTYTRLNRRAHLAKEHEAQLKAQEKEIEDLGRFRARIGPDGRPLPQPGEDEATDTVASPPPVKVKPQNILRPAGASKSNLKAVKKRPTNHDED